MPQNGRLSSRQLAPTFHPTLKLFLADDEAAASWNTMRLYLLQKLGKSGDISAEGPLGAYRDYAGQLRCKELYGTNAATPGRSNHGWGHAVDVATHDMADLIDHHGGAFGWHHWDAKWEWWHREYDGGFTRPDPGPDEKNPVLRKGSGGPGQALSVKRLQQLLNRLADAGLDEDGDFGTKTRKALMGFQRSSGLTANGVCDAAVWALLQQAPAIAQPRPKRKLHDTSDTGLLRGFDVSDARGDVDLRRRDSQGCRSSACGSPTATSTTCATGRDASRRSARAGSPGFPTTSGVSRATATTSATVPPRRRWRSDSHGPPAGVRGKIFPSRTTSRPRTASRRGNARTI